MQENSIIKFWDKTETPPEERPVPRFIAHDEKCPWKSRDVMFTAGFHNPLGHLRNVLFRQLPVEAEGDSFSLLGFDSEDIYYTTLWYAWKLLSLGFTSTVILLDGSMVQSGGLEAAGRALQDIQMPGWVGNAVDLSADGQSPFLAFEENRYFVCDHPYELVQGFQYFVWHRDHPVLRQLEEDCPWSGSTLYLRNIDDQTDSVLLQKLAAPAQTIFCDEESYPFLNGTIPQTAGMVVPLAGKKTVQNFKFDIQPLQGFPENNISSESQPFAGYFQSDGQIRNFWNSQTYLDRNFSGTYPDFPVKNRGTIFIELIEKEGGNPLAAFENRNSIDYSFINGKWVIKNSRLVTMRPEIIQHEFDHILRKLKRFL